MARAAGTFNAMGIEVCARCVKSFMEAYDVPYHNACGRVAITQDLIWSKEEHTAIREAFEELYGDPDKKEN